MPTWTESIPELGETAGPVHWDRFEIEGEEMRQTLAPYVLWGLILLSLQAYPARLISPAHAQEQCVYDEACHTGECAVYEHGRWSCTPKQYTVAVWDRTCLESIHFSEQSSMYAPIGDDGKPDMSQAHVTKTPVTFTKGCQFRYEVRSRTQQ
jgi:hypothetical protein